MRRILSLAALSGRHCVVMIGSALIIAASGACWANHATPPDRNARDVRLAVDENGARNPVAASSGASDRRGGKPDDEVSSDEQATSEAGETRAQRVHRFERELYETWRSDEGRLFDARFAGEELAQVQRPIVDAFVATLEHPDELTGFLGMGWGRYVYVIHRDVYLPHAVTLLEHEDSEVRASALRGVAFNHDRLDRVEYRRLLERRLEDTDAEIRRTAMRSLARVGEHRHSKLFIDAALEAESWHDRLAGLTGIAHLLAADQLPPDIRSSLHEALDLILGNDDEPSLQVHALQRLNRTRLGDSADRFRPAVERLLASGEASVRRSAVHAAFQTHGEVAANLIVDHMEDSDARVRYAAVEIMGRIGRHTDRIARRLDDPNITVRRAAIGALGASGAREHADAIAQFLSVNDSQSQRLAIEALGNLGADEHALVIADFTVTRYHAAFRYAALQALLNMEGYKALPRIQDLLEDDDPVVRRLARRLIEQADRP
ncbi:MAG: HEAT repeat domain-containing protein [Phycisphaeraceae bacterium]|nr:HEAT repeat domain-containing protein [Phycisphaeraceae bacterium]